MTAAVGGFVSYRRMVENLFKQMGSTGATVMHAAIGLAGEVAELSTARDRNEVIEELGDIEFYMEALRQHIGDREGHVATLQTDLANIIIDLVRLSGTVLDVAKKTWIYNREPNYGKIHECMDQIDCCLGQYRLILKITKGEVLEANQTKLGMRYPDGVYTDRHANDRLDKQ